MVPEALTVTPIIISVPSSHDTFLMVQFIECKCCRSLVFPKHDYFGTSVCILP